MKKKNKIIPSLVKGILLLSLSTNGHAGGFYKVNGSEYKQYKSGQVQKFMSTEGSLRPAKAYFTSVQEYNVEVHLEEQKVPIVGGDGAYYTPYGLEALLEAQESLPAELAKAEEEFSDILNKLLPRFRFYQDKLDGKKEAQKRIAAQLIKLKEADESVVREAAVKELVEQLEINQADINGLMEIIKQIRETIETKKRELDRITRTYDRISHKLSGVEVERSADGIIKSAFRRQPAKEKKLRVSAVNYTLIEGEQAWIDDYVIPFTIDLGNGRKKVIKVVLTDSLRGRERQRVLESKFAEQLQQILEDSKTTLKKDEPFYFLVQLPDSSESIFGIEKASDDERAAAKALEEKKARAKAEKRRLVAEAKARESAAEAAKSRAVAEAKVRVAGEALKAFASAGESESLSLPQMSPTGRAVASGGNAPNPEAAVVDDARKGSKSTLSTESAATELPSVRARKAFGE